MVSYLCLSSWLFNHMFRFFRLGRKAAQPVEKCPRHCRMKHPFIPFPDVTKGSIPVFGKLMEISGLLRERIVHARVKLFLLGSNGRPVPKPSHDWAMGTQSPPSSRKRTLINHLGKVYSSLSWIVRLFGDDSPNPKHDSRLQSFGSVLILFTPFTMIDKHPAINQPQ